jgi:integrase
VPRIKLEREPEGRIKWLEPDEEARLLAACKGSENPHLLPVVTIALETGMRHGEIMGMTWERVDLSRGVIRLEVTKSGKRREVPMRQVVYNVLAARSGPREGRVWPEQSIRTAWETAVERAKLDDWPRQGLDDREVRAPRARPPARRNRQDRADRGTSCWNRGRNRRSCCGASARIYSSLPGSSVGRAGDC